MHVLGLEVKRFDCHHGIPKLTKLSNSNTLSILLQMHGQPSNIVNFFCKYMGNLQSMIKMWHECMVKLKCECISNICQANALSNANASSALSNTNVLSNVNALSALSNANALSKANARQLNASE